MPQIDSASSPVNASSTRSWFSVPRWSRTPLAMLAILSLGVAGCGKDSSSVSSPESHSVEPAVSLKPAAAAIPASDRYEATVERRGGKVRVDPVPLSYRPKFSKNQALDVFRTKGAFPQTIRTQTADVRLGLYSNDEVNPTWPPLYINRRVWVIRYDNVSAEPGTDTAGSTDAASAADSASRVNILAFIDADTGDYLNAVQDPALAG